MTKIRKNSPKTQKNSKLTKLLKKTETVEIAENAKNVKNYEKAKIPKVRIEMPSFYICCFHLFRNFSFWY